MVTKTYFRADNKTGKSQLFVLTSIYTVKIQQIVRRHDEDGAKRYNRSEQTGIKSMERAPVRC